MQTLCTQSDILIKRLPFISQIYLLDSAVNREKEGFIILMVGANIHWQQIVVKWTFVQLLIVTV